MPLKNSTYDNYNLFLYLKNVAITLQASFGNNFEMFRVTN